tara:strand:- start:163 stop:555 length:393 start_codon:yes stop_codon:yes gene_type:complete
MKINYINKGNKFINQEGLKKIYGNNAKRIGDVNELLVASVLLKYGWEVFPNISCTGPIDLVTFNRELNVWYYLDVKSRPPSYKNMKSLLKNPIATLKPTEEQEKYNVKVAYYEDDHVYIIKSRGEDIIVI